MKKALIFQGGWEGHEPEEVAHILAGILQKENFDVKVTDTLTTLEEDDLNAYDLIVPNWTQGTITKEQLQPLIDAVANGSGLAGLHGGLGDSFRWETDYQFMVGGQWVAHPGDDGITYNVHIHDPDHPLTEGMEDFTVVSEQYYMHVDPVVKVHATTKFPVADGDHQPNGEVDMPVVWTKKWGKGNVYYCSLGHVADIVRMPEVIELLRKGFVWASR
ncbi:type 1 glutamine amidotransferase [Virgibacillus natechei]|uniref:Type 1 glutamine amidotransferase n=1 Tax=Virgibacillus natechei TaxID=1216297 RepID=A0ABS4IEF2_9BACI|nr:ThuA domain-containing protein [Virgibacillus natechei]MBP1969317.1 type 1 glutamine amidotransferase [Virgibacillus natechei]UZD12470.1 ThuA domain-containing protein [Virgibacillus natechei]